MARPKGKRSERDDVVVKVDRKVISRAKLVALRRQIPLAELLSETLRIPIERMYRQEVTKLKTEEGGE
jgi:hypothetical protein